MVTVVILISPIVIFNSINYLSIIDSYLFIFYITLFQLSMISFVLKLFYTIVSNYKNLILEELPMLLEQLLTKSNE